MRRIDWKKEILTVPNVLSILRLALIPLYVVIYLNATAPSHYYLSACILAVSCLTDLVDGQIARRFNMVSTLGKMLDPFADMVTQFTLIVCLAIRRNLLLLWCIVGLFFMKGLFQLIAGSMLLRRGKILKGALLIGKLCTAILFSSLVLMIMLPDLSDRAVNLIALVDGAFLTASFVCYILVYCGKFAMVQDIDRQTP